MALRDQVEALYRGALGELTAHPAFQALERGMLTRAGYDRVITNVMRAHLLSPRLLAFLYAVAPPEAADELLANLEEELGLDGEAGVAHPTLLRELASGAGLAHRVPELEGEAARELRQLIAEPILYGTLGELGLAALGEIVAFEYMLSRLAGRLAQALARHRGLGPSSLRWFTHHSEVDVRHAEEGLASIDAYVRYYAIPEDEALTILRMALRENVFVRRYLRDGVAEEVTR